ncbi:methyltransferase [Nevskia ramosa]|uniref:methyltransferase n=1 Tax=Nevskia ramosa TaxID=64002 RepID=UPI003D0EC5C6
MKTAAIPRKRTIPEDVLTVLSAGRVERSLFFLPSGQLDRKLYDSTNKVLEALGGRWNRKAKGHLFDTDCEPLIESAIETSEYGLPADLGWFPTPAALAARIVEMAGIAPGMLALEPSAGEGALARVMVAAGASVRVVEYDIVRVAKLMMEFGKANVVAADFLTLAPEKIFDRVVMNPPFAKRADIHHVRHALKFLKPGGSLVAIMSAGIAFREDQLSRDFRAQCSTIESLPDQSFQESGTSVNTCVVTIDL